MKLVALAMAGVLSGLVCVCGCKKKATDAGSSSSSENPASSTPTADASKSSASVPASAPGARATAPYNPTLKVPPPGPPVVINGVTINVQNAERALATASWDANAAFADLRTALRYEDYRRAVEGIQKTAADPSLNEGQKNALAQVMQEVRQAAAAQRR